MVMRVTSQAMQRTSLSNIFRITEELFRVQSQIASGKRIQLPSDDPAGMRDSLVLRTSISQSTQFIRNISSNEIFMLAADSALGIVSESITRSKELALGALNATATAETRGFAALEVGQLISQALDAANTRVKNHFVFAGTEVRTRPFSQGPVGGQYAGNSEEFRIRIDDRSTLAIGLPGSDTLGVDLNPALSLITPISDLLGGQGISAGDFTITDRAGNSATINLVAGMTVGDLITSINTSGINVTAAINDGQNGLKLTDTSPVILQPLMVTESGGGTVAHDLGLLGSRDEELVGHDLNPAINTNTTIAQLNGGLGMNLGVVEITNGGLSGSVDLSSATTIGDVLAAINGAGLNVTASINSHGNGLEIASNDPATVAIATDTGVGTTAGDLGLGGGTNVITTLIQLKLALERNDTPGITASLANLDAALASVNRSRAIIGSNLRLAETTEFTHDQDIVDQTTQLSRIEDTDLVEAASRLANLEFALQATLNSTANILQPTLLDFLR